MLNASTSNPFTQNTYYQYFYDNVGTVHFSGTIPESKVPNVVQKLLGK